MGPSVRFKILSRIESKHSWGSPYRPGEGSIGQRKPTHGLHSTAHCSVRPAGIPTASRDRLIRYQTAHICWLLPIPRGGLVRWVGHLPRFATISHGCWSVHTSLHSAASGTATSSRLHAGVCRRGLDRGIIPHCRHGSRSPPSACS